MTDNSRAAADRDAMLDTFAAELTGAAYHVALRHGAADRWLDLQLDLWRTLADMLEKWGQSSPAQMPIGSPGPSHVANS